MAFGTERASLRDGDLTIVTRTWGYGDAAEYQADLLTRSPNFDGNYTQLVQLNHCEPTELRAFAKALLEVADETERQYDEVD